MRMRTMMGGWGRVCAQLAGGPQGRGCSCWHLAALWWGDQCPLKVHVHPEPQNGTLLRNRVFGDVIKMQSH